jgi:hypothetical protein
MIIFIFSPCFGKPEVSFLIFCLNPEVQEFHAILQKIMELPAPDLLLFVRSTGTCP